MEAQLQSLFCCYKKKKKEFAAKWSSKYSENDTRNDCWSNYSKKILIFKNDQSISEVKCHSQCHKTDVQVSWKTGSLRWPCDHWFDCGDCWNKHFIYSLDIAQKKDTHTRTHTHVRARCLFWPCTFTLCSSALLVCLCVSGTPCLTHTPCLKEEALYVMINPSRTPPTPPPYVCACEFISVCLSHLLHANTHTVRLCFKQGPLYRAVWSRVTQPFVSTCRCAA